MEVLVYIWIVVGLLMLANRIWTASTFIHRWRTRSQIQPDDLLVYAAPELVDPVAAADPLDLDDQSGYCDHCNSLMPSRDGKCVTCGSVVHAI